MALLGGETGRRRLQVDDATIDNAPLSVLEAIPPDAGELLLQVAQPVSQALVLLGELRKVGDLGRLWLFDSSDVERAVTDLAHLQVLARLTALRLLEHGSLLLAEHVGTLRRVHDSCHLVRQTISRVHGRRDRAAVLPH